MSDLLALAPDPLTAARAHFLAESAAWAELFLFENWIFSKPRAGLFEFETAFDVDSKKAFCGCSAAKKPCCHALGLALFFEKAGAEAFEKAAAGPAFLSQNAEKGQPKSEQKALFQPDSIEKVDAKAANEPAVLDEKKDLLDRFSAGIADLESWLLDATRAGAAAFSTDEKPFEAVAARLADAKMSSLARRLRLLQNESPAAPDWAEKMADALGELFFAIKLFEKKESLEEVEKAELAAFFAPFSKEIALKTGETVRDRWQIFGQTERETPDRLTERQVFLRGEKTGRWALFLDFAFGDQPFAERFRTGEIWSGELTFYPSPAPLRALPKKLEPTEDSFENWPDQPFFEPFLAGFAAVLGTSLFQKTWPVAFSTVVPFRENERFGLRDGAGKAVFLECSEAVGWAILAISGGAEIGLFGCWDGSRLEPLSVFDGEKTIGF